MKFGGGQRVLTQDLTRKVTMSLVILASLGIVGWSVSTRVTLIDEGRSELQATFSLDKEITALQAELADSSNSSGKPVHQTEELLLDGFEDLANWLHQFQNQGRELGLQAAYRIGKPQSSLNNLEEFIQVPIGFEIIADTNKDTYARYLDYLRTLALGNVRVDVQKVSVSGKAEGANTMNLQVLVWMQKDV